MIEDRRPVPLALHVIALASLTFVGTASLSAAADPPASLPAAPTPDIPAPPDVAAPPADASRTASGLAWKVLKPGTGTRHAGPTDVVEAHYVGWTTSGVGIDSTLARLHPAVLPVKRLIPGFQEAVMQMTVGERSRFWMPKELAYGDGLGGRPAGMLVFEIELTRIQ